MSRSLKKPSPHQALSMRRPGRDDNLTFVESLKRQWLETIDALPDPFLVVGKDYKVHKANAVLAGLANSDIKSVVGRPCYEVFARRNSPCENCGMQSVSNSAQPKLYEIQNSHNGRNYEVVAKYFHSQDDQSEGVLQIYRDRTETIRLQHQLSQQEKLASIGQLAGGFAHEINNPLGGIIVFAQMLLRELDPKSSHYQDVTEIENAAQRCKSIVENMLDFARQRPINGKLEVTNFHAAIENAVKFATLGHNQGNRCQVDLQLKAKVFEGLGDKNRLIQVILNLCINAIQAMPKGGTLTISTQNLSPDMSASKILIVVSDSGIGIKKEHLKRIFDPFFTTKEPGQGTGLGLSVVHGIVQDLGGHIDVESKLNHGTTFRISLPMRTEEGSM